MTDYPISCLYNCDCREMLKLYPDNFFDCLVSDVPYKIATGGKRVTEEIINKFGAKDPKGILTRRVNAPIKQKWLKQGNSTNADDAEQIKLFRSCLNKTEQGR